MSELPAPTTTPATPAATALPALLWVGLAGAAAAVVGAFLDWVSATTAFGGSIGVAGIEGDGKLTAGLAVAAGIVLWAAVASRRTGTFVAAVLAGAAGCVITVYEWSHASDVVARANDSDAVHAAIGAGLWLTAAGFVVYTVVAVALWQRSRNLLNQG
jgi:hypothetical protein